MSNLLSAPASSWQISIADIFSDRVTVAGTAETVMEGADALGPHNRVLVVGIISAVIVFVSFAGVFGGVVRIAVLAAETPGPIGVNIPLGLAGGDPFGHGFADASSAGQPVRLYADIWAHIR